MSRALFFLAFFSFGCLLLSPPACAQNRLEAGAFIDYFHLSETSTNQVGIGGRVGVNIISFVQLEGEVSYDFKQYYLETFSNTTGSSFNEGARISVLHGLVGPKFQTTGPIRPFATVKAGVVDFRIPPPPSSLAFFGPSTSGIENLRARSANAALYPGAGIEAFLGPIGLRIEAGDEMVFARGVHHNWKATFGPQIRF
jgi:hypothetical protein